MVFVLELKDLIKKNCALLQFNKLSSWTTMYIEEKINMGKPAYN